MSTESLKEGTYSILEVGGKSYGYHSLPRAAAASGSSLERLPSSIRVLLENVLRSQSSSGFALSVLNWEAKAVSQPEIPLMPARVVMQDFTGVPAIVDLAAMREVVAKSGKSPQLINPIVETSLVIDHSIQVDAYASSGALQRNMELEYERNRERYSLLKWAQRSFDNLSVLPPGAGIIHQVNLEYLAKVVIPKQAGDGRDMLVLDTLVGTDSHTTMINGIGVLGWGVGGIEAEAVMLGQPYFMTLPQVVGVRLHGKLKEGVMPTDVVLTLTERLRAMNVVGQFVEFFGEGYKELDVADRAMIANMSPEYGATMGFFPVDEATLNYLALTGRSQEHIDLVRSYTKLQGLFLGDAGNESTEYSRVMDFDLGEVDASLAGPKRPQDRVSFRSAKKNFQEALGRPVAERGFGLEEPIRLGEVGGLGHGSVVIAAITSCTNTSNPTVMVGAGLLAKKAVAVGLKPKPFVKTSLAPGSQVVTEYLSRSGLLKPLEQLGFHVVGYGCTTCIGNSGDLDAGIAKAIAENKLVAASVLSGNRNFEGRINPHVKANYLASPLLVVAYALFGNIMFDPESDALGTDEGGNPVMLRDLWPSNSEIQSFARNNLFPNMFSKTYDGIQEGNALWRSLSVPEGERYQFDGSSTYIQCPPFFGGASDFAPEQALDNARVLGVFGDSLTTDHISPAGAIPYDYPAGKYLVERGVEAKNFNSYGSRRGNHEVMLRGTFANIRLKNLLLDDQEGGFTKHFPSGEVLPIYEAAMRYASDGVPLIVLAGKEYGTGSSRDWAAKGTKLLGVRAVIAEGYERIHRSNLVGMGVLPLQFLGGENARSLGLNGSEVFGVEGVGSMKPKSRIRVVAQGAEGGKKIAFEVVVRIDTDVELNTYKNGGIMPTVLREQFGVGL